MTELLKLKTLTVSLVASEAEVSRTNTMRTQNKQEMTNSCSSNVANTTLFVLVGNCGSDLAGAWSVDGGTSLVSAEEQVCTETFIP